MFAKNIISKKKFNLNKILIINLKIVSQYPKELSVCYNFQP
jgi:hypothetical protein